MTHENIRSRQKGDTNRIRHLEILRDYLDGRGIKPYDVCLLGSSILAYLGIRENHDLEFMIRPSIRSKNKLKIGFHQLSCHVEVAPDIELWENQLHRIGISDRLVWEKEMMLRSSAGYNIISPDVEYAYKLSIGRPKDQEDMAGLEKHLTGMNLDELRKKHRRGRWILQRVEYYELRIAEELGVRKRDATIILW